MKDDAEEGTIENRIHGNRKNEGFGGKWTRVFVHNVSSFMRRPYLETMFSKHETVMDVVNPGKQYTVHALCKLTKYRRLNSNFHTARSVFAA